MRDRKIRELVRLAAPKYVREAEAARKTAVYESEPERQPVRGWVGGLCAAALTAFAVFAGLWFYPTEPGITANNSGLLSEIERATLPPGTEVTQTEQTTESQTTPNTETQTTPTSEILTTPTSETLTTPTTETQTTPTTESQTTPTTESQTTPTTESQTTPTTESQTTPTTESQTTPTTESQTTLSTSATSGTPASSETAAPQLMPGDVNGDGTVDNKDVQLIMQEIKRIRNGEAGTFTPEQIAAADVITLDHPWSDSFIFYTILNWQSFWGDYPGYLLDMPEYGPVGLEDQWVIAEYWTRSSVLEMECTLAQVVQERSDDWNHHKMSETYSFGIVRDPDAQDDIFTVNGYSVPYHWYTDPELYILRWSTGTEGATFHYGTIDEDGFYIEQKALTIRNEACMRDLDQRQTGLTYRLFKDGYEAAYAEAVSRHGYFIPQNGARIERLYYLTESNLLYSIPLDKEYYATSEELEPIMQRIRETFS